MTRVLDPDRVEAFLDFVIEREHIRRRRLIGLPREEWTEDAVFKEFSFTNIKREHDRTTMGLRAIYDAHADLDKSLPLDSIRLLKHQILLNCMLYRFFGTVEMAEAIGWQRSWNSADRDIVRTIARDRMLRSQTVFTSAYIVPSCGSTDPKHDVVARIAGLLWSHMGEKTTDETWCSDNPADDPTNSLTWQGACERLCRIWGFGPFMAKEVLLDYILATHWIPDDWSTWTPVGPGGKRGAARIKYGDLVRISDQEGLEIIREIYDTVQTPWATTFPDLQLDLTDVQFQCCEFDKYSRVAEGRRPKRRFRPTVDGVTRG